MIQLMKLNFLKNKRLIEVLIKYKRNELVYNNSCFKEKFSGST
jgi:hypothetical protein